MRKNKMGSLFLISVLALAGIGISYAGWTDTITVTGTVETGDVDIDVVAYSGTWVWKIIDDHALLNHHAFIDYSTYVDHDNDDATIDDQDHAAWYGSPEDYIMVASSWAKAGGAEEDHDSVDITFNNLFPCQDFAVDFILHYDGSIPARLQGPILIDTSAIGGGVLPEFKPDEQTGYNWLEYLWYVESIDGYANGGIGYEAYYSDINGDPIDPQTGESVTTPIPIVEGSQFEFCNYVYVKLIIHIPQDPDYMDLSGAFSTQFEVIQWNEFGTTGECGEDPLIGHGADVVLAIDTSASVDQGATVITAAQAFVTALLSPDDAQVALVSWDSDAYLETTFSTDVTAINLLIAGLVFDGPSTNLGAAITMSQDQLDNHDRPDDVDHPDYMIITTDGQWNTGSDPMPIATAAKVAGTTIFVLGVGSQVNPDYLDDIASPGCYYAVGNWGDLQTVLLGLI